MTRNVSRGREAWRWFTGLGFDQEVPHHSTFSKNRHGRFLESNLFQQLFEGIVARCMQVGLVRGDHLSVDGGFVEANAAKESRVPGECPQKAQCTQGKYKYLAVHIHESARQHTRELAQTPAFEIAQRARKKVEALFAELKNHIGVRRLRLRRMKFVREQFYLAATAQSIRRLVRFLSRGSNPNLTATA